MKNIFILAAENSAENYGSQIIDEFKRKNPQIKFFGVGGKKFSEKGVEIFIRNDELAIVGIIEILSSILRLRRHMSYLLKKITEHQINAVILIDYPDFNLRFAKKLQTLGIPVYYYISPTIWAWRYSRIKLIKKYVNHIFIIFPFEINIFKRENIPFTYTGHPLIPLIKISESKNSFKKKLGIKAEEVLITLLPGSRKSEIKFLLPNMIKAMEALNKQLRIKVYIVKADNINEEMIPKFLKKTTMPFHIIEQKQGYDLINSSNIVITTCGTSNLEIAIIGVPFVAVYRLNWLSYILGKRLVKIKLYSIINILAKKQIVPELIQRQYNHKNILKEVQIILTNEKIRNNILEQFNLIRKKLKQNLNPPEIIYKKISQDVAKKTH